MSWFNVGALKDLTDNLTDLTEKVTDMGTIKDLTEKVQKAVPAIDKDLIEKLTLTSPDLVAEHDKIDEEEKRKERVKDSLAGMLPWETKDKERDILVEECKEAILALSTNKETFFGPYQMPLGGNIKVTADSTSNTGEGGGDTNEDGEVAGEEKEGGNQATQEADSRLPSKESLEKLAKLEPLPPLLADFDLDSYVGLIKRLLKEDPKLVQMQSSLSGGGAREKVFWHNYFFHCAFTRYEAGLSIDEIWSDQPLSTSTTEPQEPEVSEPKATSEDPSETHEETVVFESSTAAADTESTPLSELDLITPTAAPDTPAVAENAGANTPAGDNGVVGNDFELVGASEDAATSELLAAGGEMDELEAEILRELED